MGKIGKALGTITEEDSLLKKETALIIKNFAIFGGILCVLVVVVYGLTRGDWLHGLLAGLSLSMALLPEEFSVVLLVFLSMGAWRLSKRNVLVRRMPAIETLGSSTVLCVDKTGTLTLNKMILSSYIQEMNPVRLIKISACLRSSMSCLNSAIWQVSRTPLTRLRKRSKKALKNSFQTMKTYTVNGNLSGSILFLKTYLHSQTYGNLTTPGSMLSLQKALLKLLSIYAISMRQRKRSCCPRSRRWQTKGLRLLGVAKASFQDDSLPEKQHDFEFEFIGLLGFVDPVRPSVAQSVKECYTAGIRVIMITGDYPGTAQHIARQIGLKDPDKYITGPELASMEQTELAEKIKTTNIFARVVPEQKLAIVNALKLNGEVVAMTGDGVNDAPALKSAHIGIAMGERGTDVAREVCINCPSKR